MYVQGVGSRSRDEKEVLIAPWILIILVLQWARKLKIRPPKVVSAKILIKIIFCLILSISTFWCCICPDFWFSPNFKFCQFWFTKCWTTLNVKWWIIILVKSHVLYTIVGIKFLHLFLRKCTHLAVITTDTIAFRRLSLLWRCALFRCFGFGHILFFSIKLFN